MTFTEGVSHRGRRKLDEAIGQLGACRTWEAVFAVVEANPILVTDRTTDRLLDEAAQDACSR